MGKLHHNWLPEMLLKKIVGPAEDIEHQKRALNQGRAIKTYSEYFKARV